MLLVEEYYEKCRFHKEEYEKIIVIFQVGKFYEAYSSPDKTTDVGCARDLANVLNMMLTKKNKKKESDALSNPFQCGFPTYTLMKHITRMNDMGYAVALYDQSNNVLDKARVLKGVYTENIRKEFADQEIGTECVVYAYGIEKYEIAKGRLRIHEYRQYYCYIQMTSGKIFFYESKDTDLMRMIDKFFIQNHPEEILVYYENIEKDEILLIQEKIKANTKKMMTMPWNFYESRVESYPYLERFVENYEDQNLQMFPQLANLLENLLLYIEKHDEWLIKNLRIAEDAWNVEGLSTFLGFNRDLFKELFIFGVSDDRKDQSEKKSKTIYDMLQKSMNTMASRYLVKLLKYPTTDTEHILQVQNKLKVEVENEKLKLLKSLPDIEWFFLRWKRNNLNFRLLSNLLRNYQDLESFYPELTTFNKEVRRIWNIDNMEKYPQLLLLFEDFFERDAVEVQNEIDPLRNEVSSMFTKFEQMETSDLKLICRDDVEEYYFEVAAKKYAKWSATQKKNFQELEKTQGVVRIIPHTLVQVRTQMAIKYKELMKKRQLLYQKQKEEILDNFDSVLIKIHQNIIEDSTFGVLQRFFEKNGYCCPLVKKNKKSFLKTKSLRHALVEQLNPNVLYTPCDCEINQKENLGKLIYGENASGKSTYMKAIGTSLWLAQCGFFVPATTFEFTPYEKIYSKFNHYDNIFKGHSLFVAEMNELQYILKNASSSTLLLLDELMSGTEIHSGSSLIVSVIDEFMKSDISFCFTTHIHWIGKYLEDKYKHRLQRFHFVYDTKKDIRNEKLISTNIDDFYNRTVHSGSGPSLYGIEVAEQVGVPKGIIERAKGYRNCISIEFDIPSDQPKISKYNSKMKLEKCFVCGSRKQLHTHHILPQKYFQEGESIQHFQKNGLYNLISLCEPCHQKVHKNE